MVGLLGPDGKLLEGTQSWNRQQAMAEVFKLRRQIGSMLHGKYDAAQTSVNNERHWANADNLDPNAANTLAIRRRLRSRSRYEVVENNPYLKGCVLTISNDFIGSGPKLKITDKTLPKAVRKEIETKFQWWFDACGIRQKLWRMRTAKLVDGESFMFAYTNKNRKITYRDIPILLDFFVVETDQVSGPDELILRNSKAPKLYNEIDGVRWDQYGNTLQYHLLHVHPGNNYFYPLQINDGTWIRSDNVLHWFRQDRGWMRGIPELTPSLPLCAMLRRYTLAVVRAAEIAADFAAILETEGPPGGAAWTDGQGNTLNDDPFDQFPIEMGMFVTMPWGYKMKQLEAKQPMQMYDVFVNALLREITRPILIPFNLAAGTSKDSNMSSGVLDTHIYKGGQNQERLSCEESILSQMFVLWLMEARSVQGYFSFSRKLKLLTDHSWRWDQIGLEHTDPTKVWNAIKIAHDKGFLTDRDVQERYFNRDVEDWRSEVEEDWKWREQNGNMGMQDSLPPPTPVASPSPIKKPIAKAMTNIELPDDEED